MPAVREDQGSDTGGEGQARIQHTDYFVAHPPSYIASFWLVLNDGFVIKTAIGCKIFSQISRLQGQFSLNKTIDIISRTLQ